jgi:hypothetical protein
MPPPHAANHIKRIGMAGYPTTSRQQASYHEMLRNNRPRQKRELLPVVQELLGLVAASNPGTTTCHWRRTTHD